MRWTACLRWRKPARKMKRATRFGCRCRRGKQRSAPRCLACWSKTTKRNSKPLRKDLREVREIAQATLNNIRSLAQALHPVLLDEAGLESALDWYIPTVERQTGLRLHYEKSGTAFPVDSNAGVQIYRVLQEALNNVSRHSGAKEAWVRLTFLSNALALEVQDHGKGFSPQAAHQGIGLVGMRERAELIGATLELLQRDGGGTVVKLSVPREKAEAHGG